jgi:hypothetical protein
MDQRPRSTFRVRYGSNRFAWRGNIGMTGARPVPNQFPVVKHHAIDTVSFGARSQCD